MTTAATRTYYRNTREHTDDFCDFMTTYVSLETELIWAHKILIRSGLISKDALVPYKDTLKKLGITFERLDAIDKELIKNLKKRNAEARRIPGAVCSSRVVNARAMEHMTAMILPDGWDFEFIPGSNHTRYYIKDNKGRMRGEIYFYYLTGNNVEIFPRYRVLKGYEDEKTFKGPQSVRVVDSANGQVVYKAGEYEFSEQRCELLKKADNWLHENVVGHDDVLANWD